MSLNPQESVYIDFLNFDWEKSTEYQEGLLQILDNYLQNLQESDPSISDIPALDKQQLIDQAKSFFYCSHTGNIIELDSYLQWKVVNGDKYNKNKKITEITEEEASEPVVNGAKVSESATKTTENAGTSTSGDSGADLSAAPPYSSNYKELVELILSGKEVPGIKQIPDTVLLDQESKSTASRRTKPWEK